MNIPTSDIFRLYGLAYGNVLRFVKAIHVYQGHLCLPRTFMESIIRYRPTHLSTVMTSAAGATGPPHNVLCTPEGPGSQFRPFHQRPELGPGDLGVYLVGLRAGAKPQSTPAMTFSRPSIVV